MQGTIDHSDLKILKSVRDELTVSTDDDIILRGLRIVIPSRLRAHVVNLAHEGHQGLVKTKALLHEKVWFPKIYELTEHLVKSCIPCQSAVQHHPREPLQMSKLPNAPWQEVSVDFCEVGGSYLLVVIDNYSRYPEVQLLHSTSAKALIPHLDRIFSTFGIPKVLCSDNGPPFNSAEFKQFAAHLGFHHRKITPRWPEANGEAERFMRTLKKALRTAMVWKQELYSSLRNYRATPHSTTGVPPATALFGRPLRTRLPEIPDSDDSATPFDHEAMQKTDSQAKSKMKLYADATRNAATSPIKLGDAVLVANDAKGKLTPPFERRPLIIVEKKGSMLTAADHDKTVTRNSSHFKLLPEQDTSVEGVPTSHENAAASRSYPTRVRRPPCCFQDQCLDKMDTNPT